MSDKRKLIKIRELIAEVAGGAADPKGPAAKALVLLDDLIGAKKGRGDAEVEYLVEETVNGLALTERRVGRSAFPHRCPKPVYDAVAEVLANADRALPLDEIVAEAAKTLGDPPPEHQVRVSLRLWMHSSPSLILRNRARYRISDTRTFIKSAHAQWNAAISR